MSMTRQQAGIAKGDYLPDADRARLAVLVKKMGEGEAVRLCNCNRHTFARALAGLSVYRGTIALIQKALEE